MRGCAPVNGAWTDAQNWIDIVDHVWIGFVLIAVAGVPSWLTIRNHKSIKEVSDSVNNRPTALRDDLDEALQAIAALAHDVRALRLDLMAEGDRRRRDVADLEDRIGRHRKQES
jgi:hypothetical protein